MASSTSPPPRAPLLALLALALVALLAAPAAANAYAPKKVACPSTPLIRNGNGISAAERKWAAARREPAADALKEWLDTTGIKFSSLDPAAYPVVGLTTSGGGLRSLLTGAGVHKALDGREEDSDASTAGLYQALTYEAGLSGGAWLLGSLAANNWPTVSQLQSQLWTEAFARGLSNPPHLGDVKIDLALAAIGKDDAGFAVGLTDLYGRLLGYQLLKGTDGGVKDRMSDVAGLSNFTAHTVPFPIVTALGVKDGQLIPPLGAKQYELHPFEFGSWDPGVNAFTPMEYLGSPLENGTPQSTCIKRFDSQGFILGTSSSVFSYLKAQGLGTSAAVKPLLDALKALGIKITVDSYYAIYPNPFYKYPHSGFVAADDELNLVDGGESDQGDPIWPMLHRDIDVLLVNANSADTADNFPDGSELERTYLRAKQVGLSRMPEIPSADVFSQQGLNKRASFFGCAEPDTMTIVYLPNREISYDSGTGTFELTYTPAQSQAMISNGMKVATENGDEEWAGCLGCAIMLKSGGAGEDCRPCLQKYCYGSIKGVKLTGGAEALGSGASTYLRVLLATAVGFFLFF